jgi:lipopolysaccharide export system protein LptA
MMRTIFFVTVMAGILAAAPAARAEKADRDKPINVNADSGSYDGINNIQVVEGNVIIEQGTMRITASKGEIRRDKDNFLTAVVTGNPVNFRQKREGCAQFIEASAEKAEFDDRKDTLRLISHARLKNGDDELAGDVIVYNSGTEYFQVLGDRPDATKSDGRVRMVIQPKSKSSDPCGPKAAATAKPGGK